MRLQNKLQTSTAFKGTWVGNTVVTLLFFLFLFPFFTFGGFNHLESGDPLVRFAHKISPVVKEEVAYRAARLANDSSLPVIVEVDADFFARHGTHVAGIIGGTGKMSNGQYAGVATAALLGRTALFGRDLREIPN